MKQAMLSLMHTTGAFAPFRLVNRGKAIVLMYHRFSHTDDPMATPARVFAEQVEYLSSRYTIVPLDVIGDHLSAGRPLPHGAAAITIDDGYLDAYEIAFPILKRYNTPATVFVVTDFVEKNCWIWTDKLPYLLSRAEKPRLEITIKGRALSFGVVGRAGQLEAAERVNSLLKTLPDVDKERVIEQIASTLNVALPASPPDQFGPLTWDHAREMESNGIEIGSHTVTHPILTKIGGERLRWEVRESRLRLADALGRKVDLFCYPNGDYDQAVLSEVKEAGYRCAVTTEGGLVGAGSNALALSRIHTERDLSHFAQSTSGFEHLKNRLRGRTAAQIGAECQVPGAG